MSPPTRIAMFGSLPPDRGISAYCVECADAIAARVPVEFIAFRQMYPAWLYPRGGLQPDPTLPEPRSPQLTARRELSWRSPSSWRREGRAARGDLLHVQCWSAFQAPIQWTLMREFRRRGKPSVLTLHNLASHHRSGRSFEWVVRRLTAQADAVIVHAERLRELAATRYGLDASRVHVVPPGRSEVFGPATLDSAAARQRLGLPADALVLLFFGAIRPYKGLRSLLEALGRLRDELPALRLIVAGKLWEAWTPYAELIERHRLTDRVCLQLDYVATDQVKHLFAAADGVALPYERFQAQSGVAMAALDFGCPLIVSDVGGLPEAAPGGALVVPPGDVEALAAALRRWAQSPALRDELQAAVHRAAQQQTWPAAAEASLRVYEQVLRNAKHANR